MGAFAMRARLEGNWVEEADDDEVALLGVVLGPEAVAIFDV